MSKRRQRIRRVLIGVSIMWSYGLAIGLMLIGEGELSAIFFLLGCIAIAEVVSK